MPESEDIFALEQLLADARPEPSLPRDLVHTICTRATRQRELRRMWKARLAAATVAVLLLVSALSFLPERDPSPSGPVPAAAHFGAAAAPRRTGSHGSQWDWGSPGGAPAPVGAAAEGAENGPVDEVPGHPRRAGDRLRSGDIRFR